MAAESSVDISVVICTRNRAESLRQTLACLGLAEKGELRCAAIVVDNGSSDDTAGVCRETITGLPIHYLFEPRPGKGHAMNRALAEAPLGSIVVVLDDDMSPHPGWFVGVKAICDRWPDCDLFTGNSYIIWPTAEVPAWCRHPSLWGWAFSVMGGPKEAQLRDGRWFSGNHYWFRARVLKEGRNYIPASALLETHTEMTDLQFMLQLSEDGYRGVSAPDAVCGHRVQAGLLDFNQVKQRAAKTGRAFGLGRLHPYKDKIKQARLFRNHAFLSRVYCAASILGWSGAYAVSWLNPWRDSRMARQLYAIQRLATYREYLRVAQERPEYRLFGGQ